jgi:hypothetical protein
MYKKNLSEDTYGAPLSGQGASAEIQASVASQEAQTPMANQAAGPIPLAGQGPQAVMDQGNMNYWRGGGVQYQCRLAVHVTNLLCSC